MSPAEFRTGFDRLGFRHKSKGQFDKAQDKFMGNFFYCSYQDRRENLTYYFRNHDLVDAALDKLIFNNKQVVTVNEESQSTVNKESPSLEMKKVYSPEINKHHFNIAETTPAEINHHHEKVDHIDDLVEAAVWAFRRGGKQIKNEPGFRHKIRSRILLGGASPEDIKAVSDWHANRERGQQQACVHAVEFSIDLEACEKGAELLSLDLKSRVLPPTPAQSAG